MIDLLLPLVSPLLLSMVAACFLAYGCCENRSLSRRDSSQSSVHSDRYRSSRTLTVVDRENINHDVMEARERKQRAETLKKVGWMTAGCKVASPDGNDEADSASEKRSVKEMSSVRSSRKSSASSVAKSFTDRSSSKGTSKGSSEGLEKRSSREVVERRSSREREDEEVKKVSEAKRSKIRQLLDKTVEDKVEEKTAKSGLFSPIVASPSGSNEKIDKVVKSSKEFSPIDASGSGSNEKMNEQKPVKPKQDFLTKPITAKDSTQVQAKRSNQRKNKLPASKTGTNSNKSQRRKTKEERRKEREKKEEVRRWNAAIAKGNVFRPRKDDETVDEVHVDWNE